MTNTLAPYTEHYTSVVTLIANMKAAQRRKRTMQHPEAFVGKVVDTTKWAIPSGYRLCAMTHKLFAEDDLLVTFAHWKFERAFLMEHGIYVEDADWLSEEGYDRIMDKLEALGLRDYYINGGEQPTVAAPVAVGQREKAMPLVRVPTDDLLKRPDRPAALRTSPVAPFGPQEPPNDPRIFNKRQPDGTYRPLSEFFDKPFADRKPSPKPAIEVGARVNVPALGINGKLVAVQPSSVEGGTTRYRIGWLEGKAQDYREAGFWLEDIEVVGQQKAASR